MLDKDFDADSDKNDAAEEFHVDAFDFTEAITADNAEQGKREGDETNHEGWEIDACLQECHADPDSQSVDTGGYTQGDQGFVGKRRDGGFFFLEGFVDHFASQKPEQNEGNPVVEGGDI